MRIAFAIAAALSLAACTPAQLSTANSNIKQGAATAQVVLTTTQQAMCAAQAGANVAAGVAAIAGDSTSAMNAQKASAAAGIGCAWQSPPPPAP